MKRKHLLFTLLLALMVPLAATAQQQIVVDGLKYTITTTNGNKARLDGLADGSTLTTLNIPETVEYEGTAYPVCEIVANAFNANTRLTGSLVIPNTVTTINAAAFLGCNGFNGMLVLGSSLTTVAPRVFQNCTNFSCIMVKATTPPSLQNSSLSGISTNIPVEVPEGSLSAYSNASVWQSYTNMFEMLSVPYPGAYHEIFAPSLLPGEVDLPDDHWAGLVSPSGQGAIQMFNELVNPNLPNGLREGWMRFNCTGTPTTGNSIRLTAALPYFNLPVNVLNVHLMIKPSTTATSGSGPVTIYKCGNLQLGYVVGDDLSNFTPLQTYLPGNFSSSEYTSVEKAITGVPANARLALRTVSSTREQAGSYWDVDYNMVVGDMVSEIVPTNFQLTAHDANSASFTWDAITGATYELEYRTLDKATYNWSEWASEAVNTGSCTITIADGLRYRYYAQVKAVGYDDQGNPYYSSVSSDVIDFFPVEELVTEFPYQQTFEVDNENLDGKLYTFEENVLYTLSPQWYYHNASVSSTDPNRTIESGWGEYRYVYRYLPNNGNRLDFCVVYGNSISFGTPSPQYAVSPKIQNLRGKTMKFSGIGYAHPAPHELTNFFIQNNPGAKITIEIGVMTDPMDPTTFELIQTVTFIGTHSLNDDIVYFDNYTGGDAHIAFRVTPSTDDRNKYFKLNTVCVEEAQCAKPIRNLAVVNGSETETSVRLSWDSNNEAWEVQFRPVTSSGDNEIWQNRYIVDNPYTLTNLTANTHYQVRVRATCTNELGDWSDVIDVLTACSSTFQAIPYYENFVYVPDMEVPQCWTAPTGGSLNAPYVNENNTDRVLCFFTSASQQSRVYLPKMTNLNHLKVKIRARKGSTSQPVFLVRLCRNIEQADQNNNTVAIFDAYSLLTSEFQTFEFYTETDMNEGWIELYTNSSDNNPTSVFVDWIEVTTAVTYNKHFTGTYNGIDWAAAGNWDPWGTPTATDNVYLNDGFDVVIPAGFDAVVNAVDFDSEQTTLTIEDGASLRFNQGQWNRIGAQNYKLVNVTVKKNVRHYTLANNRYKLLAVPISDFNDHIINSGDFFTNNSNDPNYTNTDLYSFDPSYELEWRNWKAHGGFLHRGEGALYGNKVDTELSFDIRVDVPEDFEKTVQQPAQQGAHLYRWALLGNPYTCEAYIRDRDVQSYYFPYYILNDNGDALVLAPTGRAIKPLEGVFVQGWETGVTNYVFTLEAPQTKMESLEFTVSDANTKAADVFDRARIQFGEGEDFEHCDIMSSPNRLYIPSDGKQLSIKQTQPVDEIPLNFEAAENGIYTLSVNLAETELMYCHLIDNLTGADVDLLQQPEYTFSANRSDYASRFRVEFATGSSEDTETSTFGFVNANGNLCIYGIEGEATVQVIDLLGHVISSDQFSGSYERKINAAPGLYMIRLINGENVRVQKVVVR